MKVSFTERFQRSYQRLSIPLRDKLAKQLNLLLTNPRHPSLQMHPVHGSSGVYEARVDRQYRFTFDKQGDVYILRVVGNHDEVLRNP